MSRVAKHKHGTITYVYSNMRERNRIGWHGSDLIIGLSQIVTCGTRRRGVLLVCMIIFIAFSFAVDFLVMLNCFTLELFNEFMSLTKAFDLIVHISLP